MTKTCAVRAHVRTLPGKPAVYIKTHERLRREVDEMREEARVSCECERALEEAFAVQGFSVHGGLV